MTAAIAAAVVALSSPLIAGQQPAQVSLDQRIAALEAAQQEILKELRELKTLLQQQRPPMPPGAPPPGANPAVAAKPPSNIPNFDLTLAGSPSKGSATAKLVVLEFSDFECPFCGRYARDTYSQVIKEFVDTGKVRYVFRHLPIESLHPKALRASEAAECALAQKKFWEFHDRLFANQQALGEPELKIHAQVLGLAMPAYDSCMATQLASPAKIRQDQAEGGRAGITGTPTFFLGTVTAEGKLKVQRRLVGALPIANFRTAIESLLAQTK